MERTTDKITSGKAIRLLAAIIIALGVAVPSSLVQTSTAWAGTSKMVEVSPDSWQDQNPLVIANISDWQNPVVVSSTTKVDTNYATKSDADLTLKIFSENSYEVTGFCEFAKMSTKMKYVHADMYNNTTAMNDDNDLGWGALNISFPELTNSGDTGSVTVKYPYVGTYKNSDGSKTKIGVTVKYTVTADDNATPADFHDEWSGLTWRYSDAFAYPMISCAKSLYSGVTQYNTSNNNAEFSFFNTETGESVSTDDAYMTVGSLTDSECVWSDADTTFQYPKGGYTVTGSNYVAGNGDKATSGRDSNYYDSVTSNTFWKRSSTIQQTGNFNLNFCPTPTLIKNRTKAMNTTQWWTVSSYTIAKQVPDDPTKSVDKNTVSVGDSLTYTVSQKVGMVGENMSGTYKSFNISDTLDSRLTFVSGTAYAPDGTALPSSAGTFSYDTATNKVTYTFSSDYLTKEGSSDAQTGMVYAGGTYSIKLNCTVNSAGTGTDIENTAISNIDGHEAKTNEVTVTPVPPVLGNTVTTYKTSDPVTNSKVAAGDTITYTLSNHNTGAQVAEHTLVRDYIPTGTTYVDGSVSDGGAYVAANATGNTTGKAYVEWEIEGIAVDATVPVTYQVTVNTDAPATIRNYALTSQPATKLTPGDPTNPAPTNPSNEVRHKTGTDPVGTILNVVKTSDPVYGTAVYPGKTIKYTLAVTNSGDTDATNVAVYDAIPENTTYVGGSVSTDYGGTAVNDNAGVGWVIPTLAAGATDTVSFSVTVNEGIAEGTVISNQSYFEANHPATPTAPLTNSSNIVQHPTNTKVSIDKNLVSVDGDEATYEIDVINDGSTDVANYVLSDTFDNLTYKSSTGDGVTYDAATGTYTFVKVAAGTTAKATAVYTVNDLSKNFTNNVVDQPGNYTLTKVRVDSPDSTTPSTSTVNVGDTVYYLVTVTDTSSTASVQPTITDKPVSGLTLTKATTESGTADLNSDGTVTWKTESIAAGKTATMVVTGTVNTDAKDNVVNKAFDAHHVALVTDPLPDLKLIKSADPKDGTIVEAGDTITYALTLTNDGEGTATNVAVYDAIPADTTYVDGSVSTEYNGTYTKKGDAAKSTSETTSEAATSTSAATSASTSTSTSTATTSTSTATSASTSTSGAKASADAVAWTVPSVAPGESVTMTFKVTVDSDATDGTTIENEASYEANHPDTPTGPLTNKSNIVKHPVSVPAQGTQTTTGSGTPFDQTGNLLMRYWWVLALLGAVAISAGAYGLRQRRLAKASISDEQA